MKVLMVCLGNICRSPVAEGILKEKINQHQLNVEVDSAGTSGWHDGEHPDPRSIKNAAKYGVDISKQISRRLQLSDFENFDLIFAMDKNNLQHILAACPPAFRHKVGLILNVDQPNSNREVPDPYYTEDGFDEVHQLLNAACDELIKELKKNTA